MLPYLNLSNFSGVVYIFYRFKNLIIYLRLFFMLILFKYFYFKTILNAFNNHIYRLLKAFKFLKIVKCPKYA